MPVDLLLPLCCVVAISAIGVALYYRTRRAWASCIVIELFLGIGCWSLYIYPSKKMQLRASNGDSSAMLELSRYYKARLGYLWPDLSRSYYWLERAASRHNAEALAELAALYQGGAPQIGISQDRGRALALFREAARLGNGDARLILENLSHEK